MFIPVLSWTAKTTFVFSVSETNWNNHDQSIPVQRYPRWDKRHTGAYYEFTRCNLAPLLTQLDCLLAVKDLSKDCGGDTSASCAGMCASAVVWLRSICALPTRTLLSLDFTMNRVLMKLFITSNIEIIEECRRFSGPTAICATSETFSGIFITVV